MYSQTFDPVRYQGTWHEIARYPVQYEASCTNASADYIYDSVKKCIYVTNVCYCDNIVADIKQGIATETNVAGILSLTFGNVISQYIVLQTDYVNYALVGTEGRTAFWILCRKPTMTQSLYNDCVRSMLLHCYDPAKLNLNRNTIQN